MAQLPITNFFSENWWTKCEGNVMLYEIKYLANVNYWAGSFPKPASCSISWKSLEAITHPDFLIASLGTTVTNWSIDINALYTVVATKFYICVNQYVRAVLNRAPTVIIKHFVIINANSPLVKFVLLKQAKIFWDWLDVYTCLVFPVIACFQRSPHPVWRALPQEAVACL